MLLHILLEGPSYLATPIAKDPGKCGAARSPEGGETAFGGQLALRPPDAPAFFPRGEKPTPRLEGGPAQSPSSQLPAASCRAQMCVLVVQLTEQVPCDLPPCRLCRSPHAAFRAVAGGSERRPLPPVSGVSPGPSRLSLTADGPWRPGSAVVKQRPGRQAPTSDFPRPFAATQEGSLLPLPARPVRFPAIREPTAEPTPQTLGFGHASSWGAHPCIS